MNKKIVYSLIFSLSILVSSCDIDNSSIPFNLDCNLLKTGLIFYETEFVDSEITKLMQDLNATPTNTDENGHSKNFEILINRINRCEDITAEMLCYACIKTNPLQTELLIRTDSSGVSVTRIIDISTPKDSKLEFASIHNGYYDETVKLQKTLYKGCFINNPKDSFKKYSGITDTLYYSIAADTLTFNVIKNYNCCGLLKDSVVIENEIVSIYISDTCTEYCVCRCMCDYDFQYQFTGFRVKKNLFNVYLKELNQSSYVFWKGIRLEEDGV